KPLRNKIQKYVFKTIERFEDARYDSAKNMEAIRTRIEEDWLALNREINENLAMIKRINEDTKDNIVQTLNRKREEINRKINKLEENYTSWVRETSEKLQKDMTRWGSAGWRFTFQFLLVIIPIIVVLVLILNFFK
ncbi:MAG: hypothetical protein ACTSRA_06960, partial [Promethearchaeota archaeon]